MGKRASVLAGLAKCSWGTQWITRAHIKTHRWVQSSLSLCNERLQKLSAKKKKKKKWRGRVTVRCREWRTELYWTSWNHLSVCWSQEQAVIDRLTSCVVPPPLLQKRAGHAPCRGRREKRREQTRTWTTILKQNLHVNLQRIYAHGLLQVIICKKLIFFAYNNNRLSALIFKEEWRKTQEVTSLTHKKLLCMKCFLTYVKKE